VDTQVVVWGQTATRPFNPKKKKYTFCGWIHHGSPYDFSSPVVGNVSLKAVWRKNTIKDRLVNFYYEKLY